MSHRSMFLLLVSRVTKAKPIGRRTMSSTKTSLTHIDSSSNQPRMVDISEKRNIERSALASCSVIIPEHVGKRLGLENSHEVWTAKGPVFATAIVAGTNAVKKTSDLIPFCHTLPIEACKVSIRPVSNREIRVECLVRAHYKTGVEMESLTGASIAALCIYDMCKALSSEIEIRQTRLVWKRKDAQDESRPPPS